MRALGPDHQIGELRVQRFALCIEDAKASAVGGQRAPAALAAQPRRLDVHVDPDDEMAPQRLPDAPRLDRAAAQGENARTRPSGVQQLERDLFLSGAESALAILGEDAGNGFAKPLAR